MASTGREVLQNQAKVVMGVGVARVEGEFQAAALGGGTRVTPCLWMAPSSKRNRG